MTTATLTIADIQAGYGNPAWLGHGYLGSRTIESMDRLAFADALALKLANEQGMTPEQFFSWLNSRTGRHFADVAFGGDDPDVIETFARNWELVCPVESA